MVTTMLRSTGAALEKKPSTKEIPNIMAGGVNQKVGCSDHVGGHHLCHSTTLHERHNFFQVSLFYFVTTPKSSKMNPGRRVRDWSLAEVEVWVWPRFRFLGVGPYAWFLTPLYTYRTPPSGNGYKMITLGLSSYRASLMTVTV